MSTITTIFFRKKEYPQNRYCPMAISMIYLYSHHTPNERETYDGRGASLSATPIWVGAAQTMAQKSRILLRSKMEGGRSLHHLTNQATRSHERRGHPETFCCLLEKGPKKISVGCVQRLVDTRVPLNSLQLTAAPWPIIPCVYYATSDLTMQVAPRHTGLEGRTMTTW
jgi:hypothetical protein